MVCAGVHPCVAQEQDRRVQDVMRCQKVEECLLLGHDLGPQTGFREGEVSRLLAVLQRLQVAVTRAIDQVLNWSVVEQDCIKVYTEISSADQLGLIYQLCQDNRC